MCFVLRTLTRPHRRTAAPAPGEAGQPEASFDTVTILPDGPSIEVEVVS